MAKPTKPTKSTAKPPPSKSNTGTYLPGKPDAGKTIAPPAKSSKPSGSMAKDPKEKPKDLKRLSPGVYRNSKGDLVNSQGKPIPGARPPKKDKPGKPGKSPKPTTQAPAPGTPTEAAPPTMEDLGDQPVRAGGEAYEKITEDFENFDPYAMQQKYEMGFTAEMDKARQNVLSQFERRNAEQFGRERQSTQQAIVERGLDPNSPAAQAMVRDLNDREDRARQEAANAAEQAAYGVQEQAYKQSYQTAMSPAEYFQAIQSPYIAGLQGQYGSEQQKQQFEYEKQLNKQKFQQAQKLQQSGGGGGGGGSQDANAYANYVASMYGQPQQPQQSTGQAVATGVTQGTTLGIANRR